MTVEDTTSPELPADAPPPRLCQLVKWPHFDGYGFSLHTEKSRPGQHVGKIDAASPAEKAGLRDGDRIVEVNGASVAGWTHKQVVEGIRAAGDRVSLLVVTDEEHEFYASRGITVSAQLANVEKRSAELKEEEADTVANHADQEKSPAQLVENGHDHTSEKSEEIPELAAVAEEVAAVAAGVSEEDSTVEHREEDVQPTPEAGKEEHEETAPPTDNTGATGTTENQENVSEKCVDAPESNPEAGDAHDSEDNTDGADKTEAEAAIQPEMQSATPCGRQSESPTRKTPPPPPVRNGSALSSSPQPHTQIEVAADTVAEEEVSHDQETSEEKTCLDEEKPSSDEPASGGDEQMDAEVNGAAESEEKPADEPAPKEEKEISDEKESVTPETVTPDASVKDTSFESAPENGPSSPEPVTSPESYDVNGQNGSHTEEADAETPESATPPAESPEPAPSTDSETNAAPPAQSDTTTAPSPPVEDWKNLSVAEMRARLKSKKRHDPRNDNLSFKQRHEIIQNM